MKHRMGKIKDFFMNNVGMKVLAMILAALSFYAIQGRDTYEIRYDVPLEVIVEKGVAILEKETRTLEVTFRGSPEDVRQLEQKQIKAVVKPKTVSLNGSENVPVTPRDIKGASGVTVVKIKPSSVMLTFDREAEKVVQVAKPKTTGTTLIGHAELEYEPRDVRLRGPRLRLQGIATVSTEPVDVDGRVESFTRTVRVLSPSDKWVFEMEPHEITVRVKIITEVVSHSWTNIPVLAAMESESEISVRFVPPFVTITLTGRPEIIEGIKDGNLNAFVHCLKTDLSTTNMLPVIVHLPPGVEVTARIEPERVRVITGRTR